ncbi:TERF1-interacting nuclear factor 2 [Dunckerocampus dactyliophorus]|uniref:TERF1-interacting nuclear factor 2 n=1 Tax=Dunckerocampus dactyliophorus TaxID=161453 RepID=UPI002404CC1F|nr:TERF1-interacting nuclear factor 2 [Dunckerocampus dactyliophorus]
MASTKPTHNDGNLPFTALKLLAPPVRLMSAALWKVMKQRDVKLYGVVEEFVTSACETVPGLLTLRHQSKLALGLRGRLILELCSEQADANTIKSHLQRIRFPLMPSTSSAATVKTDVKITKTVESFHMLVNTLLTDQVAKEQFFMEDFPQEYGPLFDQELEKLLWEFLIRLDQLVPVPTLAQTVSWLSEAPAVLEECAQAATQPQLLKILLQHQTCLGHLEAAASLPPNMGDSILASLSLPLSGKVPSNPQARPVKSSGDVSDAAQTPDKTPFINPVIGLISNKDVPALSSAGHQNWKGDTDGRPKFTSIKPMLPKSKCDCAEDGDRIASRRSGGRASRRSGGVKRKHAGKGESASDDEEASGSFRDPSTCPIVASCLNHQPRVVIQKLPISKPVGQAGMSFYWHRHVSPAQTSSLKALRGHQSQTSTPADVLSLDNKENHPMVASVDATSSPQQCNGEALAPPGDADDYVADSEDEATKNFKGRLFMKRYCKTKHGTYFPTLREFWKPGMAQRNLSLPLCSKRRR